MSTRKQGSADKERFWRTTMRQWRRSGMSVRAFCEAHGLAQPTFYAWRRPSRIEIRSTSSSSPSR